MCTSSDSWVPQTDHVQNWGDLPLQNFSLPMDLGFASYSFSCSGPNPWRHYWLLSLILYIQSVLKPIWLPSDHFSFLFIPTVNILAQATIISCLNSLLSDLLIHIYFPLIGSLPRILRELSKCTSDYVSQAPSSPVTSSGRKIFCNS